MDLDERQAFREVFHLFFRSADGARPGELERIRRLSRGLTDPELRRKAGGYVAALEALASLRHARDPARSRQAV